MPSGNSSSNRPPPHDPGGAHEPDAHSLRIGGLVPLSSVDFPGRLACVLFLQGCPWRCPYCHNKHLRDFHAPPQRSWADILQFLKTRRRVLDGVVFSGGEPTLQRGLPAALRETREMGFANALHTSGMFPNAFARALPFLDWVGLDAKAPPDARYDSITGRRASAPRFLKSLRLLLASGVAYELRTTVDPALLGNTDIEQMQWALLGLGAGPSRLTPARPNA